MLSAEMLAMTGEEIVALFQGKEVAALAAFDIEGYVSGLLREGPLSGGNIYVHPTAKVHQTALITRSILLAGAEVCEFASIRDTIMLPNARVGHAGEVARSILGPGVSLPRFNYVGS